MIKCFFFFNLKYSSASIFLRHQLHRNHIFSFHRCIMRNKYLHSWELHVSQFQSFFDFTAQMLADDDTEADIEAVAEEITSNAKLTESF